ncbi:hypothetical protein GGS21DRAFT_501898 [Xylaria nigripes]|nr:hypothetical protein GGS21DRAFT_501898 [Xylaria nigripes]
MISNTLVWLAHIIGGIFTSSFCLGLRESCLHAVCLGRREYQVKNKKTRTRTKFTSQGCLASYVWSEKCGVHIFFFCVRRAIDRRC